MRARTLFARGAAAVACSALVAGALLACTRATPGATSPGFDVYVPMPGDASETADASGTVDAAFGLGPVDRAGRPLVAVLLVPGITQDTYNALSSFSATVPRVLQDGILARIAVFDALVLEGGAAPDPVDWPDGGALLPMLLSDTLLVDTALPCTGQDGGFVSSYLDLEHEALLPGPPHRHTTCGGRTPNEAAIDETLTLLVTADRDGGPQVTQGVAGPTRAATTTFPYLAPPK